jgi:predicted hydrocarbon binding protein
MTTTALLSSNHCVGLGRRALRQLRESLERDTGLQAATYLQEAGFAGGEELYSTYAAWLGRSQGVPEPGSLGAERLGEMLSRFFSETGWGSLAVHQMGEAVLALDSFDWAEAADQAGATYPSCHLSCGLLADFLGRMSGDAVAVMEVECRSRGDDRCRFLGGSPDTMATLYDRMAQGMGYEQALGIEGR